MGSGVPTTHLSSHLFSTTTTSTTRSKHHCLSQLAATSHTDRSSTKPGARKKCVEKQKMPGRPWGKMTTMQGGVKRAATSIRFASRGNRSNHIVVSARRTWRNVFAKSLGPCDTKTPPSMLSCSFVFLFIYLLFNGILKYPPLSDRICLNNAYTFLSSVFIVRSRIYKNI